MKVLKNSYLLTGYLQISEFTSQILPNKDVFANDKKPNI